MLQLLLLIPILGSIYLFLIEENTIEDKIKIKNISLITSLLTFLVSIIIWIKFEGNINDYQFIYEFKNLSFCHFNIGIDGISLYYVLLTTFITPIALLSNYNNINDNVKFFFISFLLLETLQIAVFVVLDLFLFYIFFESVLIPLFLVVGI